MLNNSTFFIGLDLGDKLSYIAILDQDGTLIEETCLPTTKASFHQRFSMLPPCRVAMEVGAQSRWASHMLRELGHDVLVANARKLRAIYHNPRKGDRVDAETLARLARLDPTLLSPIHHRSPKAQAHLAVIRSRDALVRSRTLLINHVRGLTTPALAGGARESSGDRLPSCSADCFASKVAHAIPERLLPALLPVLDTIASLSQQIRAYDRQIATLCQEEFPETRQLQSIAGVGPLTSLAFVLTLEEPHRFARSREVGPALGLVPKRDQSGDRDPQLRTLAPALQVQVLPRPAIAICGVSLSALRNTSWAPLVPTATCAAGVSSSPNEAGRTPKGGLLWRWQGNLPSCFTTYGRQARSTTHSSRAKRGSHKLPWLPLAFDRTLGRSE